MKNRLRIILSAMAFLSVASCCKQQKANHTLSGYIFSDTDSLPIANKSFRIEFEDQCVNHKYFYVYPFTTNSNGYFAVKVYYHTTFPLFDSVGRDLGNYIPVSLGKHETFADTLYLKP